MQSHRQAVGSPALTLSLCVLEPGVSAGQQPVVDVQRKYLQTERGGDARGGMEQRRGVAPAAIGDGDGDAVRPCRCQRCFVSLNRP